jgi:glycosyltransferase involved in cell wall biosynthesis
MQVLHIIAGLPVGGGLTQSVPALCVAEKRQGVEVSLATTEIRVQRSEVGGQLKESLLTTKNAQNTKNIEHSTSNIERRMEEAGVRVVMYRRSWPGAVYFSWGMLMGLGKEVRAADVVHIHSNWTFPVWWGGWLALRYQKTLVMSPRGCLDPVRLRHSAWKKRLVGWMDRWLLRRASVVHATCGDEKRWIEAFLGKCANARMRECGNEFLEPQNPQKGTKKIVVIPNGVEKVH